MEKLKVDYTELSIHQKISLKGLFKTDPELSQYSAIMLLWNFKTAINFFLKNDINILYKEM